MGQPKVLLATDFSPQSEVARRHAIAFARYHEGSILLVHAQPTPESSAGEGMLHAGVGTSDPRIVQDRLDAIALEIQQEEGISVEARFVDGDPATEIVRIAREEEVALIAMGTHGRTGVRRVLMGSVAEQVLRRAPCPVLTVRLPDEEAASD